MEKELILSNSPIKGYTIHAYPLSIALNEEKCKPWFYSNYIQLVCDPDYIENFYDFNNLCSILECDKWIDSIYPGIPWIRYNSIMVNQIHNYADKLCDIVKWIIDNNQYLVTHLDDFFITHKEAYNVKHNFHDIMCFGYDDEKSIFKMLAYDSMGNFEKMDISFEDFTKAYESTQVNSDEPFYNPFKILSIDHDFSYDMDINLIYKSLECLLKSKDNLIMRKTIRNVNEKLVYGLDTYKVLADYYSLKRDERYDLRPLQILWEHKKCMVMRLEYLSEIYKNSGFSDLKNEYLEVEKKALITKNLVLKFMISGKEKTQQKAILSLMSMKEIEINLIKKFMNLIENLK